MSAARIADAAGLSSLLPVALPALSRYSPWRQHRLCDDTQLQTIVAAEIARLATRDDGVARLLLAGDGTLRGFCAVTPLAWDSAHFRLPMGRLDCWADADGADTGALIAATLSAAHALNLRHVSAQVDLEDYTQFNALVANGFRLYDVRRRMTIRRLPSSRSERNPFTLRARRAGDAEAIAALLDATAFRSRFTRDPLLDPARSAAMYRIWAEKLLAADPACSEQLVVERRGELVAFGGLQEIVLGDNGPRFLGEAIFACNSRGVGCFVPVVQTLAAGGLQRWPLVEARISANNTAAARVLEHGGYRTTSADYALHLHL